MALCTNTQVKDYLGVTGSTDDTLITALIARAQAMMERHCNRVFESAEYTEVPSGGAATSRLRHTPVTEVASVSVRSASGDATALDSSTYRADADTGILSILSSDDRYFTTPDIGFSALG